MRYNEYLETVPNIVLTNQLDIRSVLRPKEGSKISNRTNETKLNSGIMKGPKVFKFPLKFFLCKNNNWTFTFEATKSGKRVKNKIGWKEL